MLRFEAKAWLHSLVSEYYIYAGKKFFIDFPEVVYTVRIGATAEGVVESSKWQKPQFSMAISNVGESDSDTYLTSNFN